MHSIYSRGKCIFHRFLIHYEQSNQVVSLEAGFEFLSTEPYTSLSSLTKIKPLPNILEIGL